jgi:hypothetical protein
MKFLEGEGWVPKDSEEKPKDRTDNNPKVNGTAPKKGSNLKTALSMSEIDRNESRDVDGDGDDDVETSMVVNGRKDLGSAKKMNGTMSEGGLISPESLEAT